MAPNGAKTEQITLHATLFLNLHTELGVPYRISISKFKIRARPFERGHPRYQSRPKSVTLSVANSQKKEKSPNTLHSCQICKKNYRRNIEMQQRNSRSERGRSHEHPRYPSRPESVTLSVANSQKTMISPHIVHSKAGCN